MKIKEYIDKKINEEVSKRLNETESKNVFDLTEQLYHYISEKSANKVNELLRTCQQTEKEFWSKCTPEEKEMKQEVIDILRDHVNNHIEHQEITVVDSYIVAEHGIK